MNSNTHQESRICATFNFVKTCATFSEKKKKTHTHTHTKKKQQQEQQQTQ